MTTTRTSVGNSVKECRILIVDDHSIVRHGLAELIARQPDMEVCGEATNVADAIRVIQTSRPNVAIVDISLDGENGIELIELIRDLYGEVNVLVSSLHEERAFAARTIRAGALGYVNKREPVDRLLDAIRKVRRGEVFLSPRVEKQLLHRAAIGASLDCDPAESLTNRELEVFEMIGRGINTRQISRKLGLSPRTVETHRVNIKTKMNLDNSAELSQRAFLWVSETKPISSVDPPTI